MVESIFSQKAPKPGMIARLKVGALPKAGAVETPGLTRAESGLADMVNLSADAKARITQGRKLDSYLRVFSSALKIMNGLFNTGYKPVRSTVEIEFIEMKKPPSFDKKI